MIESTLEECLLKALDIARHQQARSWELRAATGLARLWQQEDKRQDANDLLAPVYEWFTEGCDPFSRNLEQFKGRLGRALRRSRCPKATKRLSGGDGCG